MIEKIIRFPGVVIRELAVTFNPMNVAYVINGLFGHWIVVLLVAAMIIGAFQFAEG